MKPMAVRPLEDSIDLQIDTKKASLQTALNRLLPHDSFDSEAEAERYIEELRFFQPGREESNLS